MAKIDRSGEEMGDYKPYQAWEVKMRDGETWELQIAKIPRRKKLALLASKESPPGGRIAIIASFHSDEAAEIFGDILGGRGDADR